MIDKKLAKDYSEVISLCRLLKHHATNIMLGDNQFILMQPSMNGIRNYMIADLDINYNPFLYTFMSIPEVAPINTKFKKTKSDIDWIIDKGTRFLKIENGEDSLCKSPIMDNPVGRERLINSTYNRIPGWDEYGEQLLVSEPDSMYIELPEEFINRMVDKELCQIDFEDTTVLLARPFLGELKKTSYLGYRIIENTPDKITLKFKQKEALGEIYTYASFLKVK